MKKYGMGAALFIIGGFVAVATYRNFHIDPEQVNLFTKSIMGGSGIIGFMGILLMIKSIPSD